MTDALKKLGEIGFLPTVDVADAAKAVETAKALNEGEIGACVATVETAAAIRAALPELVLGVCVSTTENVDAAVSAGADFVVSAGLNPALVEYCVGKNVAIVPGATTATELELGLSLGLTVFNFFPAPVAGGLDAIKALAEAFPTARFIPTGAVDWAEVDAYSRCGAILAIGGRFVAPCSAVAAGDWAGITANAKRAVDLLLGLEMGHVGINCETSDEAGSTADWFFKTFGLATRETPISFFAGAAVETMKSPSFGANGHIGIAANSAARAAYHLQLRGVEFRAFKCAPDGTLIAAYLTEEIGGFAVHLCPKY